MSISKILAKALKDKAEAKSLHISDSTKEAATEALAAARKILGSSAPESDVVALACAMMEREAKDAAATQAPFYQTAYHGENFSV